jgi:ectoine hydroxylase-related dioxygenase (phytanoyl-CoA dioxygenase family)
LATAKLKEDFAGKGYFQIDSLLSRATVERLKAGIESVRDAGWPGVFSFVYDQFWTTSRAPFLVDLLSHILGPGYKQSCHLWSHYVHAKQGAAGWPPHLDNYGRPDRVTVWFALSDATLDNGCLYLIPKDLTPPGIAEKFVNLDSFPLSDLRALLQGGRALPVSAGAVLGWGPEVIHWGAYAAEQTQPRISISQEFVADSLTRREDEVPLFDTSGSLPTFEQRLYAIGKGILTYQRVETLLIRYLDLAQELVAATTSAATHDAAR